MSPRIATGPLSLLLAGCLLAACGNDAGGDAAKAPNSREPVPVAPSDWADAAADIVDPAGEKIGEAMFADASGGVLMRVRVSGLAPGWHGIHFHMVGDCSDGADGFKKSGGHVDPENQEHGLENPAGSERGDLPNLFVGSDGDATAEFFRAGINLGSSDQGAPATGPFPLLDEDGFAAVIHVNADDHMTQPIGGAGDRIACAAVTR